MATFEAWDIVKVPFPCTDRPVRQRHPALVVAAGEIEAAHGPLWLVMITSAENRGRPGDIRVSNLRAAGLPAPSIASSEDRHGGMRETRSGSTYCPWSIAKPLYHVSGAFSASRSINPEESSTAAANPNIRPAERAVPSAEQHSRASSRTKRVAVSRRWALEQDNVDNWRQVTAARTSLFGRRHRRIQSRIRRHVELKRAHPAITLAPAPASRNRGAGESGGTR
jgi:hypothetical protein